MFVRARAGFIILCLIVPPAAAWSQQAAPGIPVSNRITLDVVVTPKSGPPVAGLRQQDFTLLDNKNPLSITSFTAISGPQAPVEVIVLIDNVNTDVTTLSFERTQIDKFFKANGGHLPYPTVLAVLQNSGLAMGETPTRNGNLLSAALAQTDLGLRTLHMNTGASNDADRAHLSLVAAQQLAVRGAAIPGRKIVIWVSPGWPLLSRPELNYDAKQVQQLFHETVVISTVLRRAGVTFYSINPVGANEGTHQLDYVQFIDGVSKPVRALPGYHSLQVLAIQSGGLALTGGNDLVNDLDRCMTDLSSYYEITFDPPPAEHRDDFHTLQVQVSQPGLTARTRTIYYSQP